MSKSIKIEDFVYMELDQLRGKGDTFSDVVARLIQSSKHSRRAVDALQGIPQGSPTANAEPVPMGARLLPSQVNEGPW